MAAGAGVKPAILGDEEVGGAAHQGIQERGVDDVVRLGKCAEIFIEVSFGEAPHLFEDLELVELAKRDLLALLIPVAVDVVLGGLVDEDIDFVLGRGCEKRSEGRLDCFIVFKADDDVRINEIRLRTHPGGPF